MVELATQTQDKPRKRVDTDTLNLASFIAGELRASSPYRTGNMQRSIAVVNVDADKIEIVISVDYASYVNEQNKHKHWIQRVLDRACRAYQQSNNIDPTKLLSNLSYSVLYGGK